jgi:hypothetical protein
VRCTERCRIHDVDFKEAEEEEERKRKASNERKREIYRLREDR